MIQGDSVEQAPFAKSRRVDEWPDISSELLDIGWIKVIVSGDD